MLLTAVKVDCIYICGGVTTIYCVLVNGGLCEMKRIGDIGDNEVWTVATPNYNV